MSNYINPNETAQEIPYGHCHCGCGNKTVITQYSNASKGYKKGQPKKFITGHNIRPIYATIEDRFWASCIKGEPDACWQWQGNSERHGYGLMNFRHRDYLAHRTSYELHHGPIPPGMLVCHKCDNPPCTNPNHLFLGTPADNSADMANKGRHRRTKTRPKMTEAQVVAIRDLYASGGISQYKLAAMFAISRSAIAAIVRRDSWSDIP